MDALQFDDLSIQVSRRAGRRALLGAALALGSAALSHAGLARTRKRKRKCKRPRVKCGKRCLAAGSCCTNADCAAIGGQVCVASRCECPSGERVSGSACTRLCAPACGECQTCDDGVCVNAPEQSACVDGGFCRQGVCKPDRSFGCATPQNACLSGSGVTCPDSTTTDAKCFVDADGDFFCGVGLCATVTTDAECQSEVGEGAVALPCLICQIVSRTHVCVKPVKQ